MIWSHGHLIDRCMVISEAINLNIVMVRALYQPLNVQQSNKRVPKSGRCFATNRRCVERERKKEL